MTGTGTFDVPAGTTDFPITVTAEDGSAREYIINVTKPTKSEARLESLEIEGYLVEFDPDTYSYNLSVSISKKELLESEIKAIPKDENATVNMMGDLNLTDGIVNIYVIEVIAKNEKITRIIHLPLQSGNTKVLKEMNRKYTKEQYLMLVEKMKEKIPNVVFSTDIIVGFPGETDEEFDDTLDVVKKVNFEQIFMFIYSKREGTVADKREDKVTEEIKHKRFDKLKELYESRVDENNEKYLNTIQSLLIEGKSKNNEQMLEGRTNTNKVVIFNPNEENKIGDIVSVKIIETHKWYLKGEIV